ncbi:hypothetical protein HHK36_025356 [Tetracentron sinense]|uniref:ARID domain-containing protein n=1 Tax=Tetracentron sinense TaxID=13715 RepID=A0A834YKA6_TETSI|nr:hypothetical protein HHK36_025356 [Tetracentron sinense]
MMFHAQGASKHTCGLLAVLCGKIPEYKQKQEVSEDRPRYPFPELVSSGRLEVQTLINPTTEEFHRVLESSEPNFVYFQGEQLLNDEEIGSLVWGGVDLSAAKAISGLFGPSLPTTIYLEIPNGEKLAEVLHSMGVPYVIYWKNAFSCYAACHFREALLSVVQSSCSHTWDAFQLAHASFRLYCLRNNHVLPSNSHKVSGKLGPHLLGDPPKINIVPPEIDAGEEEESSPGSLPAIKIYDDDVWMRFLVCGVPCTLDACLLGALEDGLNALLSIEKKALISAFFLLLFQIRGSKLHNRVSAPPPPLQAGTFSRGVVTMRCDISTCSSAHISLLVSGSAQTCFDDQLLENHIKSELIEKSQLVHALPSCEENKLPLSEPRKSSSVACGATVFEVCMKVPAWASQVLRQLAPDVSYRSLVTLGIASIQGASVAAFEKDDAERLLFFCTRQGKDLLPNYSVLSCLPIWMKSPAPSQNRSEPCQETRYFTHCGLVGENGAGVIKRDQDNKKETGSMNGVSMSLVPVKQKLKVSAMRPIPHTRHHKMLPFSGISEAGGHDGGQAKVNLSIVPSTKHSILGPTPVTHRKSLSSSFQAQQIISLNPLPLKKHGCGRSPIQVCSEEEFLRDVMQFLILRGHTRLIPQGGLAEFPEAILNAKRLDLYNLYREVVSRGGFHVGNGINWKGQVFSKMRNHTMTNRMTLLDFIVCVVNSAAGDWVNCGICGEWAHFGCDRRQGLGAFKDYAKTDGLEYICPHCSITNFRMKHQKTANGY